MSYEKYPICNQFEYSVNDDTMGSFRYDGVDMGPAMVLEVSLSPKIKSSLEDTGNIQLNKRDMVLNRLAWNPKHMFQFVESDEENSTKLINTTNALLSSGAATLQGKERNDAFVSDFKVRVGVGRVVGSPAT